MEWSPPAVRGAGAGLVDAGEEGLDGGVGGLDGEDVGEADVADIGHFAERERVDPEGGVDAAGELGLVADLARAVAGAGAVGGAGVEGHADQGDVEALEGVGQRRPQQGGHAVVADLVERVDRLAGDRGAAAVVVGHFGQVAGVSVRSLSGCPAARGQGGGTVRCGTVRCQALGGTGTWRNRDAQPCGGQARGATRHVARGGAGASIAGYLLAAGARNRYLPTRPEARF